MYDAKIRRSSGAAGDPPPEWDDEISLDPNEPSEWDDDTISLDPNEPAEWDDDTISLDPNEPTEWDDDTISLDPNEPTEWDELPTDIPNFRDLDAESRLLRSRMVHDDRGLDLRALVQLIGCLIAGVLAAGALLAEPEVFFGLLIVIPIVLAFALIYFFIIRRRRRES